MSLLWRLLYRVYRIFSWVRYSLPRRFTRAGLIVLVALLATAMMGPDTENNAAYQAFTLLLALLLVGISFSWFFRAKFAATRVLPRFGTVGQSFHYRVALKNLSRKVQSDLALLEDLADPRPAFREWRAVQRADGRQSRPFQLTQRNRLHPFSPARIQTAVVPVASPNEEVEVAAQLTPLRRGVLRFAGVTVARCDPLGLFRGFARVPAAQTTLILPKRYPLPPIAFPGTLKYQQGGVTLASSVGQSEEFVSLRDYRHGDPLRHIHWRSWAKTGKPVVKEFEDEFFVRHALVLDTFTNHPRSDVFEEAVSVAASFACTVRTQESLLDLMFVGPESYCFTSGRGLAHADQMLMILASVQSCQDRPLRALEDMVLNHLNVVSGCICVFVAWDRERREFVQKIKTFGVPALVVVIVPSGHSTTLDPGPMQDAPERFHVLEVGKVEAGLARLT